MFDRKKKFTVGPIVTLTVIMFAVMVISAILASLDIQGQLTQINNGAFETTLITVKNIFGVDGIKFLFGSALTNLEFFKPLALLVISLMTVGIMETSGLLHAIGHNYRKFKVEVIIFLTLLVGVLFNFIGDYSYALLIPMAGAFYKAIGKNPIIGVITMFLGISLGYGTSMFFSFDMYTVGSLAEIAASNLDQEYTLATNSTLFISLFSLISFLILGTYIIKNYISMKVPEFKYEDEEKTISRRGLHLSYLSLIIMLLIVFYMIVPGISGSGVLLDKDSNLYIEQLFGINSPFREGIAFILLIMAAVSSWVYGKVSKNVTDTKVYSQGFAKSFEGLGYVFVLFFLIAQIGAIIEWTNIGNLISVLLIDLVTGFGFSGIPLIITLFIMVILIGIIIPGTVEKWALMSPLIIPLFMRANMTPDFTRFVYMLADGVSKTVSPIFPYFILVLALIHKYNKDDKYKVTIFGTMKFLRPAILLIMGLWILIAVCWFIIGLPIGLGISPTL